MELCLETVLLLTRPRSLRFLIPPTSYSLYSSWILLASKVGSDDFSDASRRYLMTMEVGLTPSLLSPQPPPGITHAFPASSSWNLGHRYSVQNALWKWYLGRPVSSQPFFSKNPVVFTPATVTLGSRGHSSAAIADSNKSSQISAGTRVPNVRATVHRTLLYTVTCRL